MAWKQRYIKPYHLDSTKDVIYGWEHYFDDMVMVAFIDHEAKEIRPCHGYFAPHQHGVLSERYAKKLGYTFNNA